MSLHSVELLENEAQVDVAWTLQIKVYVDGVLTGPTSATVDIYDPAGTALVSNGTCTVNGTTKIVSYQIAAAHLDDKLENYRIYCEYVISSVTYPVNFLFDVVNTPLKCSVNDADLKKFHPEISDDIWNDQTTYSTQIEQAFREVKRDLKAMGRRPAMIVDSMQIQHLVIIKTFEMIFYNFAKATDDIWWVRYLKEAERYKSALSSLQIQYDVDDSGTVDETATFGQIGLAR